MTVRRAIPKAFWVVPFASAVVLAAALSPAGPGRVDAAPPVKGTMKGLTVIVKSNRSFTIKIAGTDYDVGLNGTGKVTVNVGSGGTTKSVTNPISTVLANGKILKIEGTIPVFTTAKNYRELIEQGDVSLQVSSTLLTNSLDLPVTSE